MNIDEFRADLVRRVNMTAIEEGIGPHEAFLNIVTEDYMVATEYLPESIVPAYFDGVGTRNRNLRVDGYYQDEVDGSFSLFIVDYEEGPVSIGKTKAEDYFKKLKYFAENAINTDMYYDMEPSMPVADLVDFLRKAEDVTKYKLFIISNAVKSKTIKTFANITVNGVKADCILWDAERIYNIAYSASAKEPIYVNFREYSGGIPSLYASDASTKTYKSYLCIIPGIVLADIYEKYGSRLLEGNVRAFLSTKRKVNKKIRATILNEPTRFFAYNNGIAATAMKLDFENDYNGLKLVGAENFQIINGGQTTASLAYAKIKDKADLDRVYVQMKVTLIGEMDNDEADQLIHDISRSSNSQNAVSEADFFSTSPFHIEMEKISRRVLAPAEAGVQYETHWFYERARGQYQQAQMSMTPAKKKRFQLENPKTKVITKTDMAKYRYSWEEHPDLVSKGAQTNFMKFAEDVCEKWEKDKSIFNERWFKESVAMAIIFKTVERVVSQASWYQKSYRANIVTYTIAVFHYLLGKQFKGQEFDLIKIWNAQEISNELMNIFDVLGHKVYKQLIDENRGIQNVTQWCKREECWKSMKKYVTMDLPEEIENFMLSKNEVRNAKKYASANQVIADEVSDMEKIINLLARWPEIHNDARRLGLIKTESQEKALKAAEKMTLGQAVPKDYQVKTLLSLLEDLRDNGKIYE